MLVLELAKLAGLVSIWSFGWFWSDIWKLLKVMLLLNCAFVLVGRTGAGAGQEEGGVTILPAPPPSMEAIALRSSPPPAAFPCSQNIVNHLTLSQ